MEDSSPNSLSWKVIYTSSRQEKKVSAFLDKHGIVHYLPLYKSLRIWKDRKKWVEMPLFNGYIFVLPTENQRDQVLTIPGVVRYIRSNSKDATIPAGQIELIREFVTLGYNISEFHADESFEVGDIAEVLDGPLKGKEAEVLKMGDEHYLLVSIEAVNQSVKVKLPKEMLKIVHKKGENADLKPLW